MRECHYCGFTASTEKQIKDHVFDGALLYSCRMCGEATNIRVRLHISRIPGGLVNENNGECREENDNFVYRLGKKYWLRRGSLVRCLKCFKSLSRFDSEALIIKKYSIPTMVTGVTKC